MSQKASELALEKTRVPSWDEVTSSILNGYVRLRSLTRVRLYNLFISEYYGNRSVAFNWWGHEVAEIQPLQVES